MSSHKRFDFTKTGGFPLDQDSLSWMQQSYTEALEAVVNLIGDNVIVSGCVVAGNNVSNGWVVLNGVLYPFIGGVNEETITVKEIATSLEFEDATFKEVQFKKYCTFGVSSIRLDSLYRLKTIKEISKSIETVNTSIEVLNKQIITGSFRFKWADTELTKRITIPANPIFDANDYVGFLNNRFSFSSPSSTYNANPDGSFDFYLNRSTVDFESIEGDLTYVLIKKQH